MSPSAPVGETVHLRNGPLAIEMGFAPCDCIHSLVTAQESEGLRLALYTSQGWHIFHTIPYAALRDCDTSGTWHPGDEHREA